MPVSLQSLEDHLVLIEAAITVVDVKVTAAAEAAAAAAESFQAVVISSASAAASAAANTDLLAVNAVNIQAIRTKIDSLVRVVAIDPSIVNH